MTLIIKTKVKHVVFQGNKITLYITYGWMEKSGRMLLDTYFETRMGAA